MSVGSFYSSDGDEIIFWAQAVTTPDGKLNPDIWRKWVDEYGGDIFLINNC